MSLFRFRSYEAKCVQLGCFHWGSTSLHSTFIWTGSMGHPPSTILGIRKLEALGYLVVKTTSFCVPSFWHNTGVWQSDRYAAQRLQCAVMKIINKSSTVNFNRNKNNTHWPSYVTIKNYYIIKSHVQTSPWQQLILHTGPQCQGWNQCGPP